MLYVKDGHLCYEYNYVGTRYRIRSREQLPGDATVLRFVFDKTGDCQGVGRLLVRDRQVGATEFPAVLPFFHGWHGLDIGRDALSPVSQDYKGNFAFTGTIARIVYDLAPSEDVLLFEPVVGVALAAWTTGMPHTATCRSSTDEWCVKAVVACAVRSTARASSVVRQAASA